MNPLCVTGLLALFVICVVADIHAKRWYVRTGGLAGTPWDNFLGLWRGLLLRWRQMRALIRFFSTRGQIQGPGSKC